MEPTGQKMPRYVKGSVMHKHSASAVWCVGPMSAKLTATSTVFSLSETLNSGFCHCCCTRRVIKTGSWQAVRGPNDFGKNQTANVLCYCESEVIPNPK